MKSCFSTLGCPEWTVDQIVHCVRTYEFEGIEVRGLEDVMFLPDSPHMQPGSAFLRELDDAGCCPVVLGSSASFGKGDAALKECNTFVVLASSIDCPMVRVFGGNLPEGATREQAAEMVAPALRQACEFAAEHGVIIGLETHDAWCRGDECALLLAGVDHPALRIVWDAHHSYRHGESPAETMAAVGAHIDHVHLKDGFWQDGPQYTLFGEGDVPLLDILQCLKSADYTGYLSLEWEKKWHPDLPGPEVAFPQYASKLKEMLSRLA